MHAAVPRKELSDHGPDRFEARGAGRCVEIDIADGAATHSWDDLVSSDNREEPVIEKIQNRTGECLS